MRIDKYLKVSRLIKRRTVAKEVADHERIYVNNNLAKPGKEIKVGDIVSIHLGLKVITIKITATVPVKDTLMYELISEEKRSV